MVYLVWLGAPFLLGALLGAALARGWLSTYSLFGLGILIGFFVLLAIYLNAPPDFEHSNGDEDGGMYFGRWWELPFDAYLVGIGYFCYMLGMGVGVLVRVLVRAARNGRAGA
jgi:hypothetical protein